MSETARRFPLSGAVSRIIVFAFLASGLFFWAPGAGTAFAAPVGTIQEFSAATVSATAASPVGIATGPGNTLIFVDSTGSAVGRINTDGTGQVGTATNSPGATPLGIAKGTDSNYYFTESNISVDQTARFNVPGGPINEFNVIPPGSVPTGITAGPSTDPNAMYYTEFATSQIGRIPTSAIGGATGTAFPIASGGAPVAIVAGPSNHIWFTEQSTAAGNGGTIGEMDTTGTVLSETTVSGTAHTGTGIDGLAVGPDGFLWFTEQTTGIVGKMDPATHSVTPFQITGTAHPTAITAGPDGKVYFVDQGNNAIGQITTAGAFVEFPLTTSLAFGANAAPFGITSGPDNNIWFTEQSAAGVGKIGKLTITTVAPTPTLAISPNPLTFGSQTIGTTSTAATAVITPTGGTVTYTAITLGGTNPSDFQVNTSNCVLNTPTTLPCTVTATFAPGGTAAGVRTATVSFADNATGSPQVLNLSGTAATGGGGGTTGTFSPSPTSVAFGASPLGVPSAAVPVVFTNSTTGTVTVGTATLTGANPGDFKILSDGCSTKTIAIGATCTISLEFLPGTAGNRTANLNVPDTAGTQVVPLTGTGLAARRSGGYWLDATDGGIFSYGPAARFFGSTGGLVLNKPIVGMAATPDGQGYWLVASDGGIFSFGDAKFFGSAGSIKLNKPIVGMAATPSGLGYWLVATDGGIFSYGDAKFFGSTGSIILNKPIAGMATSPTGNGYWLVATDGGIFNYGDAGFHGSAGSINLNKPIVGMASTPSGNGYWLDATDGGIFSYGDATFHGSTGSIVLNKPMVGMAPSPSGNGYWLVASDGGIFNYGDAGFFGSAGSIKLNKPIVGMAAANF
jgi:streptogramin lyase